MKCPKCSNDTLQHLHDCAHGLPMTHMAGSERFECECGFHAVDKDEAEKNGLEFIMDT